MASKSPNHLLSSQNIRHISYSTSGELHHQNPSCPASHSSKLRNGELSHITAGFIQNSPSKGFVRADEAFNGVLASSTFDYSNVTKSGLVDNTLTTYDPKKSKPSIWRGYVNSNYPILNKTVLIDNGAVFEGFVKRDFTPNPVAAVSFSRIRKRDC